MKSRRYRYFPVTKQEMNTVKNQEGFSLRVLAGRVLYTSPAHIYGAVTITTVHMNKYTFTKVYPRKFLKRKSFCGQKWEYCLVFPGVSYKIQNLYVDRDKVKQKLLRQVKEYKRDCKEAIDWRLKQLERLSFQVAKIKAL